MAGRRDNEWESRIQDLVDDAIDSMNFSDLNRRVQNTIDSVFDELNIKGERTPYRTGTWERQARQFAEAGRRTSDRIRRASETAAKPAQVLYAKNPPGSFWGVAGSVIGGIFTGVFGITLLTGLGLAVAGTGLGAAITSFVGIAGLAVSGAVLGSGIRASRRVKRFKRYVRTLNGRTYASVEELAGSIGKKIAFVRKDLQKMLEMGFFPHGRMDQAETNLILDDETWKQYQQSRNSYQSRKKEEEDQRKANSGMEAENPELLKAIQEGEDYIAQIRRANDLIPGEEISRKLDTLELLLRKIFVILKQKPDQLPKLRKFMSFYMPTTMKLVQTYQELDGHAVEGDNVRQAKKEIEDTLDTINEAYKKLLDSFFEEAAMDVRTDISVLESMLAKEGLTKSPFESKETGTQEEEGKIELTLGTPMNG